MTTKRSSKYIDHSLNGLKQDDPRLIELMKNHYLYPPSKKPYNFSEKSPSLDGQFGQASYIAENLVKNQSRANNKRGIFVEAGAFDGELISNTLFFELRMGWTGVLIEPNPIAFERLLSKRRKAWSANVCLSTKDHPEVVLFDASGLGGGILQNGMPPSIYQSRADENRMQETVFWNRKNISIKEIYWKIDRDQANVEKLISMQCFPLYTILKAAGESHIDFLSLDVEGTEYNIIQSLFRNKDDITVNVATIENTYLRLMGYKQSELEMRYLMARNGYKLHRILKEDMIFVGK